MSDGSPGSGSAPHDGERAPTYDRAPYTLAELMQPGGMVAMLRSADPLAPKTTEEEGRPAEGCGHLTLPATEAFLADAKDDGDRAARQRFLGVARVENA